MSGRAVPLLWGLGVGTGLLLAAVVSPYVPGWGVALAPPAATLVFALGTLFVPEDETLANVLRGSVGLTLGFVAVSAPLTDAWLAARPEAIAELREIVHAATGEEARGLLHRMWIAQVSMAPVGLAALWVRRRRLAAA